MRSQEAPSAERRRAIPRPLLALLACTTLLGLTWALLTPPFQVPDENSHFAYLQILAEKGRLPGDPARPPYSTEEQLALTDSNGEQLAGVLDARPEWSPERERAWHQTSDRLPMQAQRADGGGPNPAAANPPLSYLAQAAAYRAAGGDLFDRLTAARLLGVMWLLVTVAAVWMLIAEVLGDNRLLQLAGTAVAALSPMVAFISASVAPESMLYAAWAVALWLGVRLLKRGLTLPRVVAFCAVVGLACVVKATSYALLPGALAVILVAVWRQRPLTLRRSLLPFAIGVASVLLIIGAWYVVARSSDRAVTGQLAGTVSGAGINVRELLSYVWQFYLPRTPLQTDYVIDPLYTLPLYDIWLKGTWGAYGWLEVQFPDGVYIALSAVTAIVAIGAVVTLWRTRSEIDGGVAAFFLLVAGALIGGLHWSEYRLLEGRRVGLQSGPVSVPVARPCRARGRAGPARAGAAAPASGRSGRARRSVRRATAVLGRGPLPVLCLALTRCSRGCAARRLVAIIALGLLRSSTLVYSLGVARAVPVAGLRPGQQACQGRDHRAERHRLRPRPHRPGDVPPPRP